LAVLLMVLRHGKAEKDAPTGRDADRPLANRGVRQADHIGELLVKAQAPLMRPALILSSRAERAKHTATIVAEALGLAVTFEDAIALGNSTKDALSLVGTLAERGEPALIVGHNPQFEDLVGALTGSESGMSTGELVVVDVRAGKRSSGRELGRFRLDEVD
jgi:phosphohistidine phosphatase